MTRRVVIGYEPTQRGKDALELGRLLSELLAARPLVVTALQYSRAAMGVENLEKALRVDTAESFEIARDHLRFLDPETRAIAARSPADGLADLAEEIDASVIVIGSAHRGPVGRVVFGSTAEKLLHSAPAPVAIAPLGFGADQPRHVLRLGICFDGSAESAHALEAGIELAERVHGSLTLLSVGPRRIASVLDAGLARVPSGVPAEGHRLAGPAAQAIAEAAEDFDLLLLGSRGRGPVLRTVLGSVSGPIARNAPCPVLVLPRGAGAESLGLGAVGSRDEAP